METDKRYWQISLIQSDISLGEPDMNERRLTEFIQSAAGASVKPDVILLPEMWNTGYALNRLDDLAERDSNGIRKRMSELAARHQVQIIAGSIAEHKEGKMYNTMYAYDRAGAETASYSKIHLFRLMDEEKYLEPGDRLGMFELDGVPSGGAICYDIRFPELPRTLALNGACILFVPAQWPHPRLHHWRSLLIARAIENQMYVVACNRVGTSGADHFCGHSLIIDPWGEVIAEGSEGEEIVTGEVDLALVGEVRERIPVFNDRRPQHYS